MKKIIPPVLLTICLFMMIGLDQFYPVDIILQKPINFIGIAPIIIGLMITILVSKQFKKIETEIHTFKSPRKLATQGMFKISRNPIYLGFTICLTGVWIVLGTISPMIGIIIFIVATNFWYIPYEEKVMEKIFKKEYLIYKSKVRRWI